MEFFTKRDIFVMPLALAVFLVSIFFLSANLQSLWVEAPAPNNTNILGGRQNIEPENQQDNLAVLPVLPPPEKLTSPPEIINAIYVTGWSAGSKAYLSYLDNLFQTTQINAVVIDIKDYSGLVSYNSGAIADIDGLVRHLHEKNVYIIGRITVFEDPAFAKIHPEFAIFDERKTAESPESSRRVLWQDNKGLFWLDPASKDVWDYNISLAKDVFYHGFDEVNFDYVRFPSDGNIKNMGFPVWSQKQTMAQVIESFFKYLRASLPEEKISVDLFGQTTTSTDDMGIGQIIENAFLNFDYVCPMLYPSHYAVGFYGFENPAEHPYEVIKYSLDNALIRADGYSVKFRPWLQDFDMGADYTTEMVQLEIQAAKDSLGEEFCGYMLWNPSNVYTRI